MLKTSVSLERLISKRLEFIEVKVKKSGIGSNSVEFAKKLGKSKGQNLSKSQKSVKLTIKSSKNENLSNFNAIETGSSFLTSDAKTAFNCLWLAFTKTLIL